MSPDELRALADALDKITPVMGLEELHHMETLDRAANVLRQCAEQRPVAWMSDESAGRLLGGGNGSRGTVPVHCERSRVSAIPLYLHPAPVAPQAEPKREPSEKQIADACYRYRHDFGLLDRYERDCIVNEARRWADAFRIGGSDAE